LAQGKTIHGLVQDLAGKPLSGVIVSLENFGGYRGPYEFSAATDADGRFEWNGAPDEPMPFNFKKSGYAQLQSKELQPEVENVVVLREPRQVQGVVLDADSGQPITKFRVGVGRMFGQGELNVNDPGMQNFADANGQFTLSVEQEQQDGILVTADDHAKAVKTLAEPQSGVIKMEFRLNSSDALRGTVVTPDGTPLPGVQVALASGGPSGINSLSIQNGRLHGGGYDTKIVTSDAAGRFTLQSPPEIGGTVVAAAESGFASSTVEQVRASGALVLQGFGQIEGVLTIGGAPAADRELLFTLQNIGVSTDFSSSRSLTDEQGRFKFSKIPAGEGQIVRLIKMSPNSWLHSQSTTVTVQAGQTTFITLGDSGALIRGKARLETPPAQDEQFAIRGTLSSAVTPPAAFNSPVEARAFFSARKSIGILVNPDGSFVVDSVPPGTYTLSLTATQGSDQPFSGRPIAWQNIPLTVPDNPDPLTPIDLGEILLRATPKP